MHLVSSCAEGIMPRFRSSRPEMFCKKRVFKNLTKFTGKHLYQSLFFNKVPGMTPATLLKKRHWHRCFPVNFVMLLGTPFFTKHLRWLLLLDYDGSPVKALWNIRLKCQWHIFGSSYMSLTNFLELVKIDLSFVVTNNKQ